MACSELKRFRTRLLDRFDLHKTHGRPRACHATANTCQDEPKFAVQLEVRTRYRVKVAKLQGCI
jgi:hypothetical protein